MTSGSRKAKSTPAPGFTTRDAGDDAVEPLAESRRDLEVRVVVGELVEARVELLGQAREVLDEPEDLVDQRRQRHREEADDRDERDDVDDEDRERASDPAADQSAGPGCRAGRRAAGPTTNGRTLSRAIQSSSPVTIAAPIRTATRGDRGTNRDGDPSVGWVTNGAGGSAAVGSATGWAGSSIVPQTTRRGRPVRACQGRRARAAAALAARRRPRLDAPRLGQRETIDAWETAVDASGLPVRARRDRDRRRPRPVPVSRSGRRSRSAWPPRPSGSTSS